MEYWKNGISECRAVILLNRSLQYSSIMDSKSSPRVESYLSEKAGGGNIPPPQWFYIIPASL